MNFKSLKSLMMALGLTCLTATPALADTVYVPIDFGGSAPLSYTEAFLNSARANVDAKMLSAEQNEEILKAHFLDLTDRDDQGLRDIFESATNAYFEGQSDVADEMYTEAFKIATEHPEVLALSTTIGNDLYEAGAYWLQIKHFVNNDEAALKAAIDTLIRIFPTRSPNGDNWPDEIASVYRDRMPTGIMGHELTVKASNGCHIKINGDELQSTNTIRMYSGTYAIAKVCGREITRVVKLDLLTSKTFDFDNGLYRDFTYPRKNTLVSRPDATRELLTEQLVEIGHILGVEQVVGVGYVPGDHPFLEAGFTAVLADTYEEKLIRARTAPKGDIATEIGMQDFVNSLFAGGIYHEIAGGHGLDWIMTTGIATTSVGVASLITGAVLGGLAKHENDEFRKLEKRIDARTSGSHLSHADKRDKYKIAADITFGIGGGLSAIGIGLIMFDLFYIQKNSDDIYANRPQLQFNVDRDGANVGLTWNF